MTKPIWIAGAAALLFMLCAFALWRGTRATGGNDAGGSDAGVSDAGGSTGLRSLFSSEPAEFRQLDQLRAQRLRLLHSSGPKSDQFIQSSALYDETLAKLTEEQRAQYRESRQEEIRRDAADLSENWVDNVQSMSPEELTAMLDQLIDTIVERLKEPEFLGILAEARAREEAERQTAQSFGSDEGGKNRQVEQSKRDVNATSPRMRAFDDELRRLLVKRMQERGIPIPPDLF